MNIKNINSTNFGARLRFQQQSATPPTILRYKMDGILYKCKEPFKSAGKFAIALFSVYKIISRIKKIKDSVKFPD